MNPPSSLHASPQEAMQAPQEEFLYVACLHEGTGVDEPDFIAVVDAEEGRVIHETPMPNVGDELHHYGWNRCSAVTHSSSWTAPSISTSGACCSRRFTASACSATAT